MGVGCGGLREYILISIISKQEKKRFRQMTQDGGEKKGRVGKGKKEMLTMKPSL